MESLLIEEVKIHWGDEIFSDNPRRFEYNNILCFHEISLSPGCYTQKILRDSELDGKKVIVFDSGWLRELEISMNKSEPDDTNSIFKEFIYLLFKIDAKVAVLLEIDDETVDEIIRISEEDIAWDYLLKCFNWESQNGLLLIKG